MDQKSIKNTRFLATLTLQVDVRAHLLKDRFHNRRLLSSILSYSEVVKHSLFGDTCDRLVQIGYVLSQHPHKVARRASFKRRVGRPPILGQ